MLGTLKSRSILYVEDEPEIQANIAEYLQNYFAKVYLAKDGKNALEKYQKHKPDVLLLDINLPYVDGLTIAQKIRKKNKQIKIIMLTAYTDKDKLLKATELKLTKYLIKPITPKEFKGTMKLLADEFSDSQIDQQLFGQPDYSVNIQVLGDFKILIKGELLTFKRKAPTKILQLLKLIISLGSTNIPVSKIIDTLWSDSEGDAAKSAFDSALQRLRKLLGNDLSLILRNNHISLNMQLCWIDVFALEQTIQKYSNSGFEPTKQNFDKILNLYKGEFLKEEENYWAIPYREKIQSKVIHCLEKLCEDFLEKTSHKQKIEILEKVLFIAPESELFYRHLMQQYIKQGRKSDAILVYKRCENVLQRNLGVQPSDKIYQLFLEASD